MAPKSKLAKGALWGAAGLATAGFALYWYASRYEAKRFQLETVNVITGDPTSGAGGYDVEVTDANHLRILHISDLHLAAPEKEKIDFLRRATEQELDLVVLTGDVFENHSGIEYASRILSRKPRLGAYAVLGNHDYYDYKWINKTLGKLVKRFKHPERMRSVDPFVAALEHAGFTVLRNDYVTHADDKVHIVGMDYPGGINADELMRLASKAPENALIICLLHVPHKLNMLERAGVHLAFGGHTHGGQIRIPGVGALITDSELPRHEASGLVWRGNTAIHISRGVSADPKTNFRLFCPPAATILNVRHENRRKSGSPLDIGSLRAFTTSEQSQL